MLFLKKIIEYIFTRKSSSKCSEKNALQQCKEDDGLPKDKNCGTIIEAILPKCKQCGASVEALELSMEFGSPNVYLCKNCKTTITSGATYLMGGFPEVYYVPRDPIIECETDQIVLRGNTQVSDGRFYEVLYPKDAFDVSLSTTYLHPEMMKAHKCGGDEAVLEYTLYPRCRGLFCVSEIIRFRGHIEQEYVHHYWVY